MGKKKALPEVEPVHLKSIHGIRPGVFILAGIAATVVILFFLICVMPGLLSGSGYVRFETNTVNTAIYTGDGKYIGSSEGSMYRLPSGDYTFTFLVDGVEAGRTEAHVPHRIFFTLFTHKTDVIGFNAENSPELESEVREHFLSSVASWSAVIDYDESYHYPPLFSDFAHNAVALGFGNIENELLYGAMHITSSVMYSDYLNALTILSGGNTSYLTPEIEALNGKLEAVYSGEGCNVLRDSEQVRTQGDYESGFYSFPEMTVEMGDESAADYPECVENPVTITVPSFSIAEHMVTEYEYALFVDSNPYWKRSNLENLIADGMVDSGYLSGIVLSSSIMSSKPVRNISYYAAEAYCRWRSETSGRTYTLPTEGEWYVAALSANDKEYVTTLTHDDWKDTSPHAMMGGLWEMTSTPFIPLMRYDYGKALELGENYPYDGIIVKGGSFINSDDGITKESVGVVDKDSTSPFVGFRVCRK